MLINGELVSADSEEWIQVENPATGEIVGRAPKAGSNDIDRAVASARRAFDSWSRETPSRRARLLYSIADELEKQRESIAHIVASETGNAIRTQARPEVQWSVDVLRYFASGCQSCLGTTIPLGPDVFSCTVREPYGVVAAVIPWNSPLILTALKIGMATSTGNTIVLKCAMEAPLGALALAEICSEYMPAGVVNVLSGGGEDCGAILIAHPGVDKVTFTGSTEVGKSVMRESAQRIVPTSLELGGKNPSIVFEDSDTDETALGVISAMRFTRQGQSCTAGSRLLVHDSIFDSFVDRVVSHLRGLKVGDPLDESTDMGSIINVRQYDRVVQFLEESAIQGGEFATGAVPPRERSHGFFVDPVVMTGIDPSWRIAREEVFGPVLVALPWRSEQEAIALANDTHYGLSAFIWTRDVSRAWRVAHSVQAGWVQINRGLGQLPGMPYGGIKESGLGREFSMDAAIDAYTYVKSISVGI